MPQSYEYWDESPNMFQSPQSQGGVGTPGSAQSPSSGSPAPQPAPQPQQTPPQRQHPQPQPQQQRQSAGAPPSYQAPAQQVAYVPVQPKRRGWIVALVFIICLFAFSAFCVKSCNDMLSEGGVYGVAPSGPSGNSVAVIDIDGAIDYDGSACSPEGLKKLLDKAEDDSNIKAVVLRVNSGGGTATAGEEMAEYVRSFDKPVVVSSASINASAAYEISSQSDYIFVAKSTEIGAIGTAMQLTDLSGLFDMLGIDVDVISSAESKDSSYGYRALTEDEREYYQHMIDQINEVFIDNVAEGRSMDVEDVRELATGLAFTGLDAVDNGLADEIGTLEDAMDKAAELAGVSDYSPYDLGFSSYSLYDLGTLFGSDQNQFSETLPRLMH